MKPFSIICKSCASRLKVSKASAVNQLLACPKCGTMIRVTPPAGWTPPEPIKSDSSDSHSNVDIPVQNSSDPFNGDFDDIEQILAKPQQPVQGSAAPKNRTPQPSEIAPAPTRSKRRKRSDAQAPTSVATQAAGSEEADDDQPMLPNDQWQSDEAKKRKRWVSTFLVLLSALLLIAAGVVAVIMNLEKPDATIAQNKNDQQVKQNDAGDEKKVVDIKNQPDEASPLEAVRKQNDEDEDNLIDNDAGQFNDPGQFNHGNPNIPGNEKINQAPKGLKRLETDLNDADIQMPEPRPGNGANVLPNVPNVVPNNPAPIQQDPDNAQANPNQNAIPENPGREPNGIGPVPALPMDPLPNANGKANENPPNPGIGISPLEPPKLPDGPGQLLPFRNGNQPAELDLAPEPARKKPGVAQLEKMNSKIGDLASLLEASDTSLTELRDIADQMTGYSPAGLPKYVIDKPDPIKPNLEKLKLGIGGLLFDNAPLSHVARNLSSITGIPFTIDARSIAAAGMNPNQLISVKIENKVLETAIAELLESNGLLHRPDSVGLQITVTNSKAFKTENYQVPNAPKLDDIGKQKFLAYIQGLIQPEIWVRAQNPATIKLEGDKIVVDAPAECHAEISALLKKLGSCFDLADEPTNAAALSATRTRSHSIQSNLEQAIEFRKTIQKPIGSFLNQLEKRSGVAVLVDWENVVPAGWTPQTIVPGNIDEPTVKEVILQLAQAMELTAYSINSNTMVMTTRSHAANTRDLEVYPVGKLLAGKLDEKFLLEVFETTLGSQLKSERYIYAPNCKCFIVSAPQSKQRQVEALLKRLEGI